MSVWTAPTAPAPIHALIPIPGSKSLTARALVLAAIAAQPTVIRGGLESRDTALMCAALESLGARIEQMPDSTWHVTPMSWPQAGSTIDCGLAGTVLRFIPPLAALANGVTRFVGDPQASKRPVAPLLEALSQLDARITYLDTPGQLPFSVTGMGQQLDGQSITVDASASSQFLTALLLAAPLSGGATVRAAGPVVSLPHITMTARALEESGVPVTYEADHAWQVAGVRPTGGQVTIEPDLSNAGPLLAAAMVSGGTMRIPLWPLHTTQVGDQWRQILTEMGAHVHLDPDSTSAGTLLLQASGLSGLRGIVRDMHDAGELVPTVAALAIVAGSPSRLTGIGHLRGHETDRLHAIVMEARKLGAVVEELPDGLSFRGLARPGDLSELHGAQLDAWADHRMATFAAILGLAIPGISVSDIEATSKTFPTFTTVWQQMLESSACSDSFDQTVGGAGV